MSISRFISLICGFLIVAFGLLGAGIYSALAQNALFRASVRIMADVEAVMREFDGGASNFLQPVSGRDSGVTVNLRPDDDYVLMAGYFDGGNQIRLLDRNGSPVAKWPVSFTRLFPDRSFLKNPPRTDLDVDIHGALIEPDGSVVFNFEYAGSAKLTRCGEPVWTLEHPTHHSVEPARGGGYWIAGRKVLDRTDTRDFPPFTNIASSGIVEEDLILKVNEKGVIVDRLSVPGLIYDNGLEALLTATGATFSPDANWDRELVHLNKIGELSDELASAFEQFEAGDLLLSLRTYNLILVIDPQSRVVKWRQTGPWIRQHDPEFNRDGTITVFNNNAYETNFANGRPISTDVPRSSNIMRVDPAAGTTRVAYGGRPGQEMLSHIRGKHDPTPRGGFLITEFEAGRVFETDAHGRITWEYVNRYDANFVAEITEARVYPSSYFTVADWRCE